MLKIYGPGRSRAFRVFWMCKESNIPFEQIPVTINVDNAQAKEDWYLKLNPNGRVPTIEDDGFVMWESAAINMWLAEKYKSPLYPTSIEEKGRMLQWALFFATDVEGLVIKVYHHRFSLPPEQRVPAIADDAEKLLLPALAVIEKSLGDIGHLGYERWDLADFVAACTLFYLTVMKYDFSQFPKLSEWLKSCLERPAAKAAIAMRG
jgi:glutathione S-transferase